MTIIANPIYDEAFCFLMEDNRVAQTLLSALLGEEITEAQLRQIKRKIEAKEKVSTSILLIEFLCKIKKQDKGEHSVWVEVFKTWKNTSALRSRQCLGIRYLEDISRQADEKNPEKDALPLISVCIVGHRVDGLDDPVSYVLQDDLPAALPSSDTLAGSKRHDFVVAQVPLLKRGAVSRAERLLGIFDQDQCWKRNDHYVCVDESVPLYEEEQLLVDRLMRAACSPDVLDSMRFEDEFLPLLENRDTVIMLMHEEIELLDRMKELNEEIEQCKEAKELNSLHERKERLSKRRDQIFHALIPALQANCWSVSDIAKHVCMSEQEVRDVLKEGE